MIQEKSLAVSGATSFNRLFVTDMQQQNSAARRIARRATSTLGVMNPRTALLLVGIALTAVATHAAPESALPPDVVQVRTAGYWKNGSREGAYRAVVVQEGWEHVWSRLRVEWVAAPSSRGGNFEIVSTATPLLPVAEGTTLLDVTLKPKPGKGVVLTVVATENMPPFRKSSYQFLATTPGRVERVGRQK